MVIMFSDMLVSSLSFWRASAPGVTGEWESALGEAKEQGSTGRRASGEETVFFRFRNSILLFLSRLFADSLFFFLAVQNSSIGDLVTH